MKRFVILIVLMTGFFIPVFSLAEQMAENSKMNIASISKKIEELTGAQGVFDEKEQVFKVSFPRSDIEVNISGVKLKPGMGLTVWAAFKLTKNHAMMMGDMVLLENQVNDVMSTALDNGLEVTALHNHFFWDTPKVMFMHISGAGDTENLAGAVGKVFQKIRETADKKDIPSFQLDSSKPLLDTKVIENIMGVQGQMKDGVYKLTLGRIVKMDEHEMGNAMGVNTWAAFIGNNEQAIVDGDFAMKESELQNVLKALRKAGINVVAIHNHMTMESPRMIFLHYWGYGPLEDLAKGLKAALDTQNLKN